MTRDSLRRLQKAAGGGLATVVILLLANSAFLVTAEASDLVALMVQAHLLLGVALLVVLPLFVASHVAMHRDHANHRARVVGRFVAGLAGVGAVAGLALWGLEKQRALRWLVLLHEAGFVGAVGAYVLHRMRAVVTPALTGERVAVGLAGLLVLGVWGLQLTGEETDDAPDALFVAGLSEAATVDGHVLRPEDLADAGYCAQCHEEIAARWEGSAHRHGSLNDPFYAATLKVAQAHRTPEELAFCGACHDPALLFTGRMTEHPVPSDPDADAGITCLLCHDIAEEPGRLGNGSYVLTKPDHYPYYGSEDEDEQEQNRRLIRSKPDKHKATFRRSHLHSSELCIGCHKAHIPPELNRHRWLPGQNDYDPWFDSGAGGHSARTFFPPKSPQMRCQDCHMPRIDSDDPAAKGGTVPDHAFPGANTALPAVLEDDEWSARSAAFLDGVLTADIGAVSSSSGQVMAPRDVVTAPPGAPLTVDVVVRNVGSGHLFPGGVADLREAWLEVSLVTGEQVLAASGLVDGGGHLDPFAYRWNTVLLDRDGAHLEVHEVEDAFVVLSSRRIMLGASDVVRVSLPAPPEGAHLRARVMHRKFARSYVEFALGADAPAMPAHVLAEASIRIEPGAWRAPPPAEDAGPRLRNLGIGRLLRGETRAAREASLAASLRLRDDPGPLLDLARIALADGDVAQAEDFVRRADKVAPGHPTGAWLLGRIRAGQGQHERAVAAYDVALASFPRDRQVLALRGESLFQLEQDEDAAAAMEAVLAIDPEHLAAHALLARIRSSQGDTEGAARHQAAWDRYRPRNEDKAAIAKARERNPALDQRANQQWVIPLRPPKGDASPAEVWAR
ncbi:MAG: tetratricopeptide repeat protein [Deltaproteobacteria bacterium]|nr:tetratricopeptide repeat protein [Deltaproteobacteria bacterium]